MGIITLALVSGGFINSLEVPDLVKFLCALSMALGTSVGGWKSSVPSEAKYSRCTPSTASQPTSTRCRHLLATLLHLPVSTTHVVSGSIMGVGSAQRVKAVHWSVARQMVTAWVMTIPCTAVMGALSYVILTQVFF